VPTKAKNILARTHEKRKPSWGNRHENVLYEESFSGFMFSVSFSKYEKVDDTGSAVWRGGGRERERESGE
jgi:hypothetical protein